MIPQITEINFPVDQSGKKIYTLHQATVNIADMGDRVITTQVRVDGAVTPTFVGSDGNDLAISFKGEKYILPIKEPQAQKGNESMNSLVDLTFQHWAIYQLKRYYFVELSSVGAGTAIPDKYEASLSLNLQNFCTALNNVLGYYFNGKIVVDLNPNPAMPYDQEPVFMNISYSYIWEVIQEINNTYNRRWSLSYNATTDVYSIRIGYDTEELSHVFEYGYEGGLLKVERQVQSDSMKNIILGRGGERNLPKLYFKDYSKYTPNDGDWDNGNFEPDPDAIPELVNIYFDKLRDINFRKYVQGWAAQKGYEGHEYQSGQGWAYEKGYTDETFQPVEYVKDDASIAKYGELWGALQANDNIYPSIQNYEDDDLGRIDEIVDAEQVTTDDLEALADSSIVKANVNGKQITNSVEARTRFTSELRGESFTVAEGLTGALSYAWFCKPATNNPNIVIDTARSFVKVYNASTGQEVPSGVIPAGTYYYVATICILNDSASAETVTYGIQEVKCTSSDATQEAWKPTFDIWVKNIWGTTKGENETPEEYVERVWTPILGDALGNEAAVVFSTGMLAVSSDYEFVINAVSYDTSKSRGGVDSEWRLTLVKSDAELDATGYYIPNANVGGNAQGGDHFFFIGIDMPHAYVVWAEERLNQYKTNNGLGELSEIAPTWVVNLDKVRINTPETSDYGQILAEQLAAGARINLKSTQFIGSSAITLYIQSLQYTWQEPTKDQPYIVPDIEIVLSDKVVAVKSSIEELSGQIDQIRQQYVSLEHLEETIESIVSAKFLGKVPTSNSSVTPAEEQPQEESQAPAPARRMLTASPNSTVASDVPVNTRAVAADNTVIEDGAPSVLPSVHEVSRVATEFKNMIYGDSFRAGAVGGRSWGIYKDKDGNAIIETDNIVVRKKLTVNELVANQVAYVGGKQIFSAASIECIQVIDTDAGYECYFDQKEGTVKNLFVVGDVAYSQVFDPSNLEIRTYKRKVVGVAVDHILLSKTDVSGTDVPEVGDTIVQYGNYTEADRQYVIIQDVIGGGYQRMLSGLNSVTAQGQEYHFAGYDPALRERWFVGNKGTNGQYAEYVNGQLNIKAIVNFLEGSTGIENIEAFQELSDNVDGLEYLKTALGEDTTTIAGGLILTSLIQLGYKDAQNIRHIMAGVSGLGQNAQAPAAWFGGPMVDHEANPTATDYAKSLIRFDGTGYLAKGNITWDANGYGQAGGSGNNYAVKWGADGIRLGSGVYIGSDSDKTLGSILALLNKFDSWFEEDTETHTLILKRDGNNNARNFAAYGEVTAGGVGSDVPGGGGIDRIFFDTYKYQAEAGSTAIHIPLTGTNGIKGVLGITALEEAIETAGKVDAVMMNGTRIDPVNKVINLGTVITAHQSLAAYRTSADQDTIDNAIKGRLTTIEGLIPSAATTSNPLADKSFVNSSIATATATFRGTSASGLTEAQFLSWANGLTKDNNDYVFWNTTDSAGNVQFKRYKYNGTSWVYEYTLNNSSFTAAQWAAVNSGITSSLVTAFGNKYDKPSSGIPLADLAQGVKDSLALADSALQSHQTIYALTVQKNGTTVGTYTPNSAAKTININAATSLTMPTGLSAGTLTSGGNIAVTFQTGYSLLTATQKAILDLLEYDTTTHTLLVKKDGNNDVNFAAYGEVTAGGVGQGGGGGAAVWGGIEGTLSNQTDLWNVLQGKQASLGTGTNGQILSWQNGAPAWVAAPATGVTKLINRTGEITQAQLRSDLGLGNLAYQPDVVTALGYTPWKIYGSTGAVDINTLSGNGNYYISGAATNTPLGHSNAQLICSHIGDTYGQISIPYLSSASLIWRGGTNTSTSWRTIIDSVNYTIYCATATQGSHADTAYGWGNHASEGYMKGITASMITTALGTTAVAKATDADTLDGQHASYFATASSLGNYVAKGGDTMTGDLGILTGDTDKAINFWYNNNHLAGASWRIVSQGTGSLDTNYLSFQTGGSSSSATIWNTVLRLTMNNRYVGVGVDSPTERLHIGGNVLATGNITANGSINATSGTINGNTIYHSGNLTAATLGALTTTTAAATYLPLSGGTITATDIGSLNIYRNNATYSCVHFYGLVNSEKTDLGYLGFNGVSNPVFVNSSGTTYSLYHSGNLTYSVVTNLIGSTTYAPYNANGYLPLNGGTLTGTLVCTNASFGEQLEIKRLNASADSAIKFSNSSGLLGYLGIFSHSKQPFFYDSEKTHQYDIYHSGNSNKNDVDWLCKNLTAINAYVSERIGIGTSSPTEKQHLYATSGQVATLYQNPIGNLLVGMDSSGGFIWQRSNAATRFATNATERMRITEDGKIGVGTPSPTRLFSLVGGSIDISANVSSASDTGVMATNSANNRQIQFIIGTSGKMGIYCPHNGWNIYTDTDNTVHLGRQTYCDSNFIATGELTAGASSDSRFKDNQQSLRNADAILKALRPMEFDWNDLYHSVGGRNEGHDVGFLAQDVQPLIPSAIGKVYGEYLRLDYNKVTPYLVAGWQSHETRIERLERENRELKMEIQRLRS